MWVGEHWINSTKLLKLAQLYPVYCTEVLMAFIILGNLLIKKVFPIIILNNNKYCGHCTLSCGFLFSSTLEIRSISVITYKVFTNLGKLWRSCCYCVGICGCEHHSICTAVGLLWSTLHYPDFIERALYTVANSDPKVECSGSVPSLALYNSAKPHFQIRNCHCLCELEKFCKTRMFKVRY